VIKKSFTQQSKIICQGSSFFAGGRNQTTSGTYIDTLKTVQGCDSIVTTHLTVTRMVTQQTKSICAGDFFFAGGANRSSPGTYTDTLRTMQGCDSVVVTNLTVRPLPSPVLGSDRNLCTNAQIIVTPGLFATYEWHNMSTANNLTIKSPGQYWVRVTDSFKCTAADTINVTAVPFPTTFLPDTDSICSFGKLGIQPLRSFSNYTWSTGATGKQLEATKPGVYWLEVVDGNGCKGRDTIVVALKQCMQGLYVPTAFTPNNDHKNDKLRAMLFGNIAAFEFLIYNRLGQLVFQTKSHQDGWDGKVEGIEQGTASYVWMCRYKLEGQAPKIEKGSFTLIR
jgi:gliding motility-associated-like protein